jgi:hypothetical protein
MVKDTCGGEYRIASGMFDGYTYTYMGMLLAPTTHFILSTQNKLRVRSSGMLRHVVLVRATWHNVPEDCILHSHLRENLKIDVGSTLLF